MGQYTAVNHINNECCVGHTTVQLIAKTRAVKYMEINTKIAINMSLHNELHNIFGITMHHMFKSKENCNNLARST
jgi:hypothetical protein